MAAALTCGMQGTVGVAAAPLRPRLQNRLRTVASAGRPAVAVVAAPPAPPSTLPLPPARERTPGSLTGDEDPWTDPRWVGVKWTVYRDVAYDLTAFMDRHPAGSFLLRLAIGRDCTALFESYHLRPEVAVSRLRMLPVLQDFPVHAVPRAPRPNDSEIYNAIRDRVRTEVFAGNEATGAHRSGSEGAAATILGYAAASYTLYATNPGLMSGLLLGLGGAWCGLTVQHCGNHGAMSTKAWVNEAMGAMDDLIGGSSLAWRYHHQVSHHIHCNDELDEDVVSAFPLLRFDPRLPRHWYHRYQAAYMWAAFPLLQLAFQVGDMQALITGRTAGATMYGATTAERASVILGKLAHYGLLLALPWALHGGQAALTGAAAYSVVQSIVLASTFAVSHNVPETKPLDAGPTADNLLGDADERDWGLHQILTSASWGGVVGNFFTGGLNLQVEHHLFPAISFVHYPAIAAIVRDECAKRGVQYSQYNDLPTIIGRFIRYMSEVGVAEQPLPRGNSRAADLARLLCAQDIAAAPALRTHFMSSRPAKRRATSATMSAAVSDVIDNADFERIDGELRAYDERRETVIKRSRDIQKMSKMAIFSLHRGAEAEAEQRLASAKKAAEELLPLIKDNPTLRPGSYSNAIEEYAEALAFRCYLNEGRLIKQGEVELAEVEEYLGGVLDFTGELGRLAIAQATRRDEAAVQKARDLVEAIMGQFLQFDLRNGSLRKKFDALKYTLKKLEDTLYDLSRMEAGLRTKPEDIPEPEAGGGGNDDD